MPCAHDLMVVWRQDPCSLVMCPICQGVFTAELGVTQECAVMLADETEYKPMWLIFCSHLCAWLARRERK